MLSCISSKCTLLVSVYIPFCKWFIESMGPRAITDLDNEISVHEGVVIVCAY